MAVFYDKTWDTPIVEETWVSGRSPLMIWLEVRPHSANEAGLSQSPKTPASLLLQKNPRVVLDWVQEPN
jgi:hypothetical protein